MTPDLLIKKLKKKKNKSQIQNQSAKVSAQKSP